MLFRTAGPEELAPVYGLLGYLYHVLGRGEESGGHYREALRLDPRWVEKANRDAWRMATSPRTTPWRAGLALLYARQASQATRERDVSILETRAAAEAATGQRDEAARTIRKAVALVSESADPVRYNALQQRLRLYEEGTP